MPNHCEGDLTVTGPQDQLGAFLAKHVTSADGAILNLDSIYPEPSEFKRLDRIAREYDEAMRQLPRNEQGSLDKDAYAAFVRTHGQRPNDGFNSGGYDWRVANWGTKWGCYQTWECPTPIEKTEGGVVLHFSTAWSPFKFDLLEVVSAAFPALRFQYDYYESGMQFQGHVIVSGGEIEQTETGPYDGERGG